MNAVWSRMGLWDNRLTATAAAGMTHKTLWLVVVLGAFSCIILTWGDLGSIGALLAAGGLSLLACAAYTVNIAGPSRVVWARRLFEANEERERAAA